MLGYRKQIPPTEHTLIKFMYFALADCGGLTLAKCQAPTKVAHSHSPLQLGRREKFNEGLHELR